MVHITYTKILIGNPTQPIDPLYKELGMNKHTVYERAYGFGSIYETGQPDELLAFYNRHRLMMSVYLRSQQCRV